MSDVSCVRFIEKFGAGVSNLRRNLSYEPGLNKVFAYKGFDGKTSKTFDLGHSDLQYQHYTARPMPHSFFDIIINEHPLIAAGNNAYFSKQMAKTQADK